MGSRKRRNSRDNGAAQTPAEPGAGPASGATVPWDTGMLMCIIGVACFTTAIGFDTRIFSSFDLSKLAILYVITLVLVVGYVTKSLARGEFVLARTPLDWPVWAIAAAGAVSTALSVDRHCSLFGAYKTYEGLIQILIFIMFYYAASRLRRPEVVVVIMAILATGLAAAVYGYLQRTGHDPLKWSISIKGRVISNFGNPVFFATYVVMAVPLGAGLLFRGTRYGRGGPSGPRAALMRALAPGVLIPWLIALGGIAYFAAQVYPVLQMSKGPTTITTAERLIWLFSCTLAMCVALGFARIFVRGPEVWPAALGWVAAVLSLLCNAAFYCTRTRGAFLGLVAGLAFFPLHMGLLWAGKDKGFRIAWASYSRNAAKWIIMGSLIVGLNVAMNLWPETSVVGRLKGVLAKVPIAKPKATPSPAGEPDAKPEPVKTKRVLWGSAYKRMLLYYTAIDIFKAYPVWGSGPDAIERVIAKHWSRDYQLGRKRLVEVRGFENRIHNEVLDTAASQGLVGLVARVWLWLAYFVLLWTAQRRVSHADRPVFTGLGAAWVAYEVQNVMAFPTIPISIAVWTLMGCTVAWVQNGGEPDHWPTRRLRLWDRPRVPLALILMAGVAFALWGFLERCLVTPYQADAHYMTGKAHERAKRWDRAAAQYGLAAKLNPYLHVYRESLNQVLLRAASPAKPKDAQDLARQQRYAVRCRDSSVEMIRVSPWRSSAYISHGTALSILADIERAGAKTPGERGQAEQLYKAAEAQLKKAVEVNPYNRSMRGPLIDFYRRRGRLDDAAALLQETFRYWPKDPRVPLVTYDVANKFVRAKNYDKALRMLEPIRDVVTDKERPRFNRTLGMVYSRMGKWDKVAEVSREILALRPDIAEAQYNLTTSLVMLGDLNQADAEARTLIKEHPKYKLRTNAMALLADKLQTKRKWDRAIAWWTRVVAERPSDTNVRYRLAACHFGKGDLDRAEAECQRVLKQDPKDKRSLSLVKVIRAKRQPTKTKTPAKRPTVKVTPAAKPPAQRPTIKVTPAAKIKPKK